MDRGGDPEAQEIGTSDYRIRRAQDLLLTTKQVFDTASTYVENAADLLKQHQQALAMCVVRSEAEKKSSSPEKCMTQGTNAMMMKMQLDEVYKALGNLTYAKAVLQDNSSVTDGPFGMERDFKNAQEDELLNYSKRSAHPCSLKWWDPEDEKTWAPYGWHVKDMDKWADFTAEATKSENGLEPAIPWDPENPQSWVPYGWKVKDQSRWVDFSSQQSSGSANDFFLVESPKVRTTNNTLG